MSRFVLLWALASAVGLVVCGVAGAATCTINGGAAFTKVPDVTVSFVAPGEAQYSISNSPGDGWSPWADIDASSEVSWILSRLPDPDGVKVVYMQFRTGPEDVSPVSCQASIVLDTTPPETDVHAFWWPITWIPSLDVTMTAYDAGGVAWSEYGFAPTGPWLRYDGEAFTMDDETRATVYYRSMDLAGNLESTQSHRFPIDSTGPVCVARSWSTRRGWTATVRYIIRDASHFMDAVVRIKNSRGVTLRTIRQDSVDVRMWHRAYVKARWRPGRYLIRVTAVDEAGHRQSKVGKAYLYIRKAL